MIPAGLLCKLLADFICIPKSDADIRKRAVSVLKLLTPGKLIGEFPQSDDSVVIGFNHPSLGEIFRLLAIAFDVYKDKEFLFPVNLPWYEAMTSIIPKLSRLGIHITPMITPSTEGKLKLLLKDDNEKLAQVQHIKNVFERRYMRLARNASCSGKVIFVAPTATRQLKVIGDHIHPTMTILAHMVYKNPDTGTIFLPVAVLQPEKSNGGINLFRQYIISSCKAFSREEAESLSNKSRSFDMEFLLRIDKERNRIKRLTCTMCGSTLE